MAAPKTQPLKKRAKHYRQLAKLRGFKWAKKSIPKSTMHKTLWKCKEKHTWPASYHNIAHGKGCPECSGKKPKDEDAYHALAKSRGYKWRGETLPENVQSKTLWECDKEHQWETTYDILNHGSHCPVCSGRKPKDKDAYDAVAQSKNLEWTGTALPQNSTTQTTWRCKALQHILHGSYQDAKRWRGCCYCQQYLRRRL